MLDYNNVSVKELQQAFEIEKYHQSFNAKTDKGGLMYFCEGCAFVKFDTNKNRCICNLAYDTVTENQVCAKNYIKEKQIGTRKIETTNSKPRTIRKKNNGKG